MPADINLQAWFETHAEAAQTAVIPYVMTARDVVLQYDLRLLNAGRGSVSRISQSNMVTVAAGQRTRLADVSVVPVRGGHCEVALTIRYEGKVLGEYSFDCSAR